MASIYYNNDFTKIPYEEICMIIFQQYAFEFNESKAAELLKKVEKSPKIEDYLLRTIQANKLISEYAIINFIRNQKLYLITKPETLCIASMFFSMSMFEHSLGILNEIKVKYIINILRYCKDMKLLEVNNNFFTRCETKLQIHFENNYKFIE